VTSRRLRCAGRGLPAALLLLGPGLALAQQGYWSERFGLGLWVPSGYAVQELQEGSGLLLVPHADGAATVEVVTWPKTTRTDTATDGARQHEALLRNRFHYRREGDRDITGADGTPGLLVEGVVEEATRDTYAAPFACFSAGDRHCLIGTFAPEASAAAAGALVEAVASGFTLDRSQLPTAPVAPEPVRPPPGQGPEPVPVLTGGTPQPTAPPGTGAAPPLGAATTPAGPSGVATQGPGSSSGPPPIPSLSGAGALYHDESGFSVWVPDGWALSTADGIITVEAPGTGAGAILWPVRQAEPGLQDSVTKDLVCASSPYWRSIEVTSLRMHPARGDVQLVAARLKTDQHRLAGVFSYAVAGRDGLLAGAYAPEEAMAAMLPALAQVARSFTGGPWPAPETEEPAAGGLTEWTAPDGKLRAQLPEGWEATGGVTAFNGDPRVQLEAHAPAPSLLRVRWAQPVVPSFREATPLLQSLGWEEGAQYTSRAGPDPLLILRRLDPEGYLRQRILAAGQPTALDAPAITRLPGSGKDAALVTDAAQETAAFTVRGERNGLPVAQLWVVSTGDEPPGRGANVWQAAYLGCEGLPGEMDAAKACLRQIVRSAQPGAEGGEALKGLLTLAQQALRSSWLAAERDEGPAYVSVLTPGVGPAPEGGEAYRPPPGWLPAWEPGPGGLGDLWEFTTAWWRRPGERPSGAG